MLEITYKVHSLIHKNSSVLQTKTYLFDEKVDVKIYVIASGGQSLVALFVGNETISVEEKDLLNIKIDGNTVKI